MTRRLFLAVVLAVLGGLLLAAGAPGQLAAPGLATAAPNVIISDAPPDPSSSSSATFTFSSDDPLATLECSLDGVAGACDSATSSSYSGLVDGSHTFVVKATNVLAEVGSDSHTWTVDTVAPETTIDPPFPPNPSGSTVTFHFSSEPGATFQCSRRPSGVTPVFSTCSSPRTYDLADGTHTFQVRAIDASGNIDPTPAPYTWTVSTDSAPPETTIDPPFPPNPSGSTVTFHFSSEPGATFQCSRRPSGVTPVFSNCSSPRTYNGLADGTHTFQVRAIDSSDNTDPSPAFYTWTVGTDSAPPETTITSGPIGTTPSTSATFEFTSSEGGSTFECRRNLSAFIPCSSPITYSALADGTHTFEVRATDPSDNVDATPASATWTVASNTTGVPTVGNLRAIAGDHRVRLVWTNPAGIGIRRIEIRRGINRLLVYTGRGTEFVDTRVFNSRRYTYSVLVVDDLGQRSPAAGIFALPRGKLRAPRDGRPVLRPPMLRWLPRARATYYNIQVYRNGKKILSRWPARTRFQLRIQWRYQDRTYRLRDGRYVWYVFPGFGKRADNRYGREWGHSLFVKR